MIALISLVSETPWWFYLAFIVPFVFSMSGYILLSRNPDLWGVAASWLAILAYVIGLFPNIATFVGVGLWFVLFGLWRDRRLSRDANQVGETDLRRL